MAFSCVVSMMMDAVEFTLCLTVDKYALGFFMFTLLIFEVEMKLELTVNLFVDNVKNQSKTKRCVCLPFAMAVEWLNEPKPLG